MATRLVTEGRIGILDAYGGVAEILRAGFDPVGVEVRTAGSLSEADDLVHEEDLDLLVVTMCLPEDATLPHLARMSADPSSPPVCIVSGCNATALAGKALFPRAIAFLELPIAPGVLREELLGALQRIRRPPPAIPGIVAASPAMQEVLTDLQEGARVDSTVLVTGETGTGKELVARTIHELSGRSEGPFVAIDCAGLPAGLLESELFGHARGSFTGAHEARRGLFEAARGGTVFLDEVADAPTEVQVRLLRVLQEREVRRLGERQTRRLDVRVIAASQRDLEKEVEEGRFRADLYYRLRVIELRLPPLRERLEDIEPLVLHFLRDLGREGGMTSPALGALRHHSWPGNVRELRAVLEIAAITGPSGAPIGLAEIREEIRRAWIDDVLLGSAPGEEQPQTAPLLRVGLAEAGGVRTRAAEILGVSRTTLWRMMKRIDA